MSIPTPEETHDGLPGLEQRLARAETLLSLYEQLIRQIPIGIMMWHLEDPADPGSFRLIAANPAMYVASGFDVAAEAGHPMLQIFPQAIESGLAQAYAEVARSGQARDLGEVRYGDDRVDAGLFAVQALPLALNYMCTTVESVTERRRAEEALRQAVAQERDHPRTDGDPRRALYTAHPGQRSCGDHAADRRGRLAARAEYDRDAADGHR